MKLKTILIILFMAIAVNSDIIPDATQPILVIPPTTSALSSVKTTIIVKFSTDTDFQGLRNNQVVSIKFDPTSAIFLQSSYSCELEVRSAPAGPLLGYNVVTRFPASDDRQSAFCILNNAQDLPGGVTYYFTVTLAIQQTVAVHKLRAVWASFSNATDLNRIHITPQLIVRSLPNFDLGVAENTVMSFNKVEVLNLTPPTTCSAPCRKLFPYSTFQVEFELTINNFYDTDSTSSLFKSVIGFSWPNKDFDFTNASITTTSPVGSDGSLLQGPLLGTLTLTDHVSSNTKIISGISENMYPGRKFSITISGIVSPAYVTTVDQNNLAHWSFLIFHKLDYARFGTLSTKNYTVEPIFKTNIIELVTPIDDTDVNNKWRGINQADYKDIFENASWPIRFVFTIPPMPNGGYVKIDHDYSTHKIFNFISSTCDFSDLAGASSNPNLINDIFSGLVSQRPVCFSVNDSLTQSGTPITVNSGIYFKVPVTNTFKNISLTVWGLATKCSENDYLNENASIALNIYDPTEREKNSKKLSFSIRVYKAINQVGTEMFSSTDLIAEKANIEMYNKCYGNLISHKTSHNTYSLSPFYSDNSLITSSADVLLFKEFNSWNFTNTPSVLNDLKFINSANNLYINDPVVDSALEFGLAMTNTIDSPVPIYITTGALSVYETKISFFLSKGFFTKKTDPCDLRWFNSDQTFVAAATENVLTTGTNLTWDNTVDGGHLSEVMTLGKPSLLYGTIDQTTKKFITALTSSHFGFKNSCYDIRRINGNTDAIHIQKSLYSNIDLSYVFERKDGSNDYFINRAGRFIKFVSSYGFLDPTNDVQTVTVTPKFYFAFSTVSDNVCLLKINSEIFDSFIGFNSIMMTLINIRLLTIDSSDLANQYPFSPKAGTSSVYSNNTVYPFNFLNAKTHGGLLNRQYNNLRSSIVLPYGNNDYVKNGSDYYDFIGSTIMMHTTTNGDFTGTTNVDAYLPVYCPQGGEMIDNKDHLSFVIPSISVVGYDVKSSNTWEIDDTIKIKRLKFSLDSNTKIGEVGLLFKRDILLPANSNLHNRIGLYFSEYSTTVGVTDKLFVAGSIPVGGIPPETRCNSMILFTSDLITSSNSLVFESITISSYFYSANGFYVGTKKFNKAFFYGIGQSESRVFVKGSIANTELHSAISGVTRPVPSHFNNVTPSYNNLTDDLALYCLREQSLGNGAGNFYYNYDSVTKKFETDFQKLNTDSFNWTFTVNDDADQGAKYFDDKAYKLDIDLDIPSSLPKISTLILKSSQLSANAICAVNHFFPTYPATLCGTVTNNTVECSLTNTVTESLNPETLNVCCYNLSIGKNTEIVFESDTAIKIDTHIFSTSFITRDGLTNDIIYGAPYETGFIPFDNSSIDITGITSSITSFFPDQTSQDAGLGILYMRINLGRKTVPNQRIRISGKISETFIRDTTVGADTIKGIKPKCELFYVDNTVNSLSALKALNQSTNYFKGNYLIDRCVLTYTNTPANSDTIEIYNKNYIHKCKLGVSPNDYLVVKLYPVILKNLSANNYTIKNGVHDFETANKITNDTTTTFPVLTFTHAVTTTSPNNICEIFNILPSKIGNLAEYIFKIDLSSINSFTLIPNEVTIFFDSDIFPYPDNLAGILCDINDDSSLIKYCNWERTGFFNVGLNFNLAINTVYYLRIKNLINGHLKEDHIFRCSLNIFNTAIYSSDPTNRRSEIVSYGKNSYVNSFPLVIPDPSAYDNKKDFPSPNFVPYVQIIGPYSDLSYKIEHVSTQIPERNDYVLYLIYDNVKIGAIPVPADKTATEALRDSMISSFNTFKALYANKILTHGNLRFEEIDYGAQKHVDAGTLNDSFVTPSFRFVMPNGYMFTSTSNANLQQFFDESLNEFLNNTFWPYFVYKNENGVKKLRLDYLPSATLDNMFRIFLIYDSTNTNHNAMLAKYNAFTVTTAVLNTDYTKDTIDLSTKYILYNLQDIKVPSIRIIMPDRVIRIFDNDANDLNAFFDTIYANYNSFTSVLPALITPITKTKVYLFENSTGTNLGADSNDKTLCRHKVSADLQASFFKFKEYYENLTVLPSKEIEFIHIDLGSASCAIPGSLDGNDSSWPRIVIYLPDGRKITYDPNVPNFGGSVLCPHKSYYWDIHNLITKSLKKYISKADLLSSLSQNDAAVVFIGNSSKDRDVFDSIIEYNSIYLPFYYCVSADCLSDFKVANGDVLFINSKKSPYVAGTTDVRVLANGYTSSMLAKFIKHSYAPNVVYISDEVLYQIFYKRQPAILVTMVNNANVLTNKSVLDQLSVELRVS